MAYGIKRLVGVLALFVLGQLSFAATIEDAIKKAVEPRLGISIGKITKTKFADLYEIDTPRGLVYTDKAGSFVIVNGTFIDTPTGKNLSELRLSELGAFKFSDLPLSDAIKTVNGNGSRVIFTVEDPNCGYCKRLAVDLAKIKNVTIYTLLIPILGDDSLQKTRAIWCATDRSKTWTDFMIAGKPLPEKTNCETPIERNIALARKLRVMGTPLLLFPSGDRVPGAIPLEQIESKLASHK